MFRIILVLFSAILFANPAFAESLKISVPANRSVSVYNHAVYNTVTCYGLALPNMKVRKPPAHGKVAFRKTRVQMSKEAGKCAGRTINGIAVVYTPKKGFRGHDEFKLEYSYFTYEGSAQRSFDSNKYLITVK